MVVLSARNGRNRKSSKDRVQIIVGQLMKRFLLAFAVMAWSGIQVEKHNGGLDTNLNSKGVREDHRRIILSRLFCL